MMNAQTRIVVVLTGNIENDPIIVSKYGNLLDAVRQHFALTHILNAKIPSWFRPFNALLSFQANNALWHEAFRKNNLAFVMRSRRIGKQIKALTIQPDVVLQIGALFDVQWYPAVPPSVIYTDYTTQLEYDRHAAGRSPFNARSLSKWLRLEQRTYQRAAYICTRSELVKQSLIEHYNIPAEKISVVGGGVNFVNLPALPEKQPSSQRTVLFIGQNFHRKGGDLVLRAFAKARAVTPNAILLLLTGSIIPQGLPLDGVQIIAPVWDREAIAKLYQQADLFILPSRLETWGDVILEAMAYGLPCIGVYGEPMEEIIEHEKTGLLAHPEDVGALADALIQLLGDDEKRLQYGRAARQRVEQRYTWEYTLDSLAPIIEQASAKV